MAVRSLNINIGFKVKDRGLKKANDDTDELRHSADEAGESFQQLGFRAGEAANETSQGFQSARDEVAELGDRGRSSADELTDGFNETSDSLSNMGSIGRDALGALQSGIASIMSMGFLGYVFNAAASYEALEIQIRHAAESEEQYARLNEQFALLEERSRGMVRSGTLMSIAAEVEAAGLGFDSFIRLSEPAMVAAIGAGRDFEQVMMRLNRAITLGLGTSEEFALQTGIDLRAAILDAGHSLQEWREEWDATRREMFVTDLVMKEHEKRYGAFNETIESGSGSVERFKGAIGDFAEMIGMPILGPLTSIISGVTDLFDTIREDPIGQAILEFMGWAVAIGSIVTAFFGVGGAFKYVARLIGPLIIPFLKVALIGTIVFLVVEDLITAFFGLGDSATENLFNAAMEFMGFNYTFQQFREDIIDGLIALGGWFVGIWTTIREAWTTGEGWLGNMLHGLAEYFMGWIEVLVGYFQIGFGFIWGIFTGDWSMLEEGFKKLFSGIEKMFTGFNRFMEGAFEIGRDIMTRFIDWVPGAFTAMLDWFGQLPELIGDRLSGLGEVMKSSFSEGLEMVRNLLPFSPPKDKSSPLADIMDTGFNIIDSVRYGIDASDPLSISEPLEPVNEELAPVSSSSNRGGVNVVFHNTTNIEMPGIDEDTAEDLQEFIDRRAQQNFPEWIEEFFRNQGRLRPRTTER